MWRSEGPACLLCLAIVVLFGVVPFGSPAAQPAARVFPFAWSTPVPLEVVTLADLQHALIWTGHYNGMADGRPGAATDRAVGAWQASKGLAAGALSDAQKRDLVAQGLKERDAAGWATLTDDAVGFSVGLPTALSRPQQPTRENGTLWYRSEGNFHQAISVRRQDDACATMDRAFDAYVHIDGPNRKVEYMARQDDWFVVAGQSGDRRFYTRAQCRGAAIVTAINNFPANKATVSSPLFVAVANSLALRAALDVSATPAPRIVPLATPPLAGVPGGRSDTITLANASSPRLNAQDLFEQASRAVYVVNTPEKQGSAIAISPHELLTNCHVIDKHRTVTLVRGGRKLAAEVISMNTDADRCVLRTSATLTDWRRVRTYDEVRVGDRVYTIGAPKGLDLTLAEGIVSSKRRDKHNRLLQTDAPISHGSSGGGLFDERGDLLGITTFMMKDGQNLNFAIAAEDYAK